MQLVEGKCIFLCTMHMLYTYPAGTDWKHCPTSTIKGGFRSVLLILLMVCVKPLFLVSLSCVFCPVLSRVSILPNRYRLFGFLWRLCKYRVNKKCLSPVSFPQYCPSVSRLSNSDCLFDFLLRLCKYRVNRKLKQWWSTILSITTWWKVNSISLT